MPAEYLSCPKCGNRIDEVEGQEAPVPAQTKPVNATGQWGMRVIFVYCPHCGAVLGTLPTPD